MTVLCQRVSVSAKKAGHNLVRTAHGAERVRILGANAAHGARRTNADKHRAVMTLLADAEWGAWSDREIARRCAVGHQLVGELRPTVLAGRATSEATPAPRTCTTKHGTVAEIGR